MATPTKKATAAKKAPRTTKDTGPNGPVKTTKVAAETMATLENDLQAVQEAAKNGKPVRKMTATPADAAAKTERKGKASAERHAKAADQANLTEKNCTRCGIVKPRADFQKNVTHSDGMQSRCKQCMSEIRKERTAVEVASA